MTQVHYDAGMLSELRAVMEDEFSLLLETFFTDTAMRLDSIASALSASDSDAFRRACHSLKGSASNLGLAQLVELCRAGEEAGLKGDLSAGEETLNRIREEVELIIPLLRAEMSSG